MRRIFLGCFLGVLSVNCIAGCGFMQRWCGDNCDCCAFGCKSGVKTIHRASAKTKGQPGDPTYVMDVPVIKDVPTEQMATAEQPSNTPDVLPALPAMPLTGSKADESPTFEKIVISTLPETQNAKPSDKGISGNEHGVEIAVLPNVPAGPDGGVKSVQSSVKPFMSETSLAKEKNVALKSVHIQYGQTENFQSVTGQVQQFRKTWRLRYAAVDQEDVYGGCVILEGSDELSKLRDGQHVRVRGILMPPEDRLATARYRVLAIEVLD